MERTNCPLCKRPCVVALDNDQFGIYGPIVLWHTPGPEVGRDLEAVRHINSAMCLASGLEPSFARSVAADLEAGVHLAAHP